MYRYEAHITIDNGNSKKWEKTIVEFPKQRQSWTTNDPDEIQICKKAASELGEDPNKIDFFHSGTYVRYLGPVQSAQAPKSAGPDRKQLEKEWKQNRKEDDDYLDELQKKADREKNRRIEEANRAKEIEKEKRRNELIDLSNQFRARQTELALKEEEKFNSKEALYERIKWLDKGYEFYTSMSDVDGW